MNSVEYKKNMDDLVQQLLMVIEKSEFSAKEAEGIPAYLKNAIETNNLNALRASRFRIVTAPES